MVFGGWGGPWVEIPKKGLVEVLRYYFSMYPESFSSLPFQTKKLTGKLARETYRNPAHKTQEGVKIRTRKKQENEKMR